MRELMKRAEIVERYTERFGEDALVPYVTDIEETVKRYEQCLEEDKPYEELFGKWKEGVLY